VKAVYKTDTSNPSFQTATTLGFPPIGPLWFTNITDSSFIAHWEEPTGVVAPTSYVVTYWSGQKPRLTFRGVPATTLL